MLINVTQKTKKTPYFVHHKYAKVVLPICPPHHISYPKQSTAYNIFDHRPALPCLEFDETKPLFLPPILFLAFILSRRPQHTPPTTTTTTIRKPKPVYDCLKNNKHTVSHTLHYSTLLTHPQYPITHTNFFIFIFLK